jgi:hypothetical protein
MPTRIRSRSLGVLRAIRACAIPASRPVSHRRLSATFGTAFFKSRIPSAWNNESGTMTVQLSSCFRATLSHIG